MLFNQSSPFSVLRSILSLKWSPGCLSRRHHLTLPTMWRSTHWQRHPLVKNTLPSYEFYDRNNRNSLKRKFLSVPTVEAPRTLQQQQQDEVSTLAPLIIPPPPAVGIPLALRMAAGEKLRPPQVWSLTELSACLFMKLLLASERKILLLMWLSLDTIKGRRMDLWSIGDIHEKSWKNRQKQKEYNNELVTTHGSLQSQPLRLRPSSSPASPSAPPSGGPRKPPPKKMNNNSSQLLSKLTKSFRNMFGLNLLGGGSRYAQFHWQWLIIFQRISLNILLQLSVFTFKALAHNNIAIHRVV